MQLKNISLIIPCYNEENIISKCIYDFINVIKENKGYNFDIIIVDDGSTDESINIIKKIRQEIDTNNLVKIIKLSKNYGFHIAVTAGIEFAKKSDAVIVCPADDYFLSTYVKKIIDEFIINKSEIVWSVRKENNRGMFGNFFRKIFYNLFIFLSGFKNYPKNGTSAFFMLSSKVVQQFLNFKEFNRIINILIFTMGFKQSYIEYEERNDLRKSKYDFFSKLKLALDCFVSYSYVPMRIASLSGVIISLLSFIYLSAIIIEYFFYGTSIEGWASIIVIVLFLGGVQLLTLGFLGEYIWRISVETKKRPLYLIDWKEGLD
jgi:dolichol-phosphate mannosyltransferase